MTETRPHLLFPPSPLRFRSQMYHRDVLFRAKQSHFRRLWANNEDRSEKQSQFGSVRTPTIVDWGFRIADSRRQARGDRCLQAARRICKTKPISRADQNLKSTLQGKNTVEDCHIGTSKPGPQFHKSLSRRYLYYTTGFGTPFATVSSRRVSLRRETRLSKE